MPLYLVTRQSHLLSNHHTMHCQSCRLIEGNESQYALIGDYEDRYKAVEAAKYFWPPIEISFCPLCFSK